jgi:hypothetical protein
MRGATPPLPQCAFMAWCLVKQRDNFTFYTQKKRCMDKFKAAPWQQRPSHLLAGTRSVEDSLSICLSVCLSVSVSIAMAISVLVCKEFRKIGR